MDIKCPNCGTVYEIDRSELGNLERCRRCGNGFIAGGERIYICTQCGASTTTPRQTWLGVLNCLGGLIALLVVPAFLFMIHQTLGIAVFVLILVSICIRLSRTGKTFCRHCGNYDTLISATSPRGQQIIKQRVEDFYKRKNHVSSTSKETPESRLMKLQELKEAGIISEEEYEEKRRKIMAQI